MSNTYLVILATCTFLAMVPACGPYMGDDLTGVGNMHTQGTGPSGETSGGPGEGVTSRGGTTVRGTTTTTGGYTTGGATGYTTGGATTGRATTTTGGYTTTTTGGGTMTTTGGHATTTTGAGGTTTTTTGGYGTTTGGGSTTTTGGTTSGYSCGGTWQSFAGTFFSHYCASCHSSAGPEGTAYFDGLSYASVVQNANSIAAAISNGGMPEGSSLTDQQKNEIIVWLHCSPPPQ